MTKLLVILLALIAPIALNAQVKVLFNATKAESASNADWVIDADLHNLGYSNGPPVVGQGNESNPQQLPTPAQSTVTASTPETYWNGALSSWGIDLVKKGYTVETLPYNGAITYGNSGNPQDLSNYKIFIDCEPNILYTATEKTAIIQFVQNGGGLFMVSDHTISDRNGDGADSPMIWNDLMSNNGIATNPFGITFDLANFSQTTTNIPNLPADPILHGVMGDVTSAMWSNGTSMTLSTTANSSVLGVIFKTGSAFGNSNVMFSYASYGNGKVAAIGDSSPCDDGTGDSGDALYNGWTADAGGNHERLIMNATLWLASSGQATPTVITLAASAVTGNSATLNGTVNPNAAATNTHFEWGTTISYGNSTSVVAAGAGSAVVSASANISGLISGTTYHFRLVGVNSGGTSNGNDMTFTPGAVNLTTTAVTSITMTTAASGGNISSDGGATVTARGVCWNTSANPTIAGTHTTDGSGIGSFSSSLTGLSSSTTYHVRAYATNTAGTYYGNDIPFTTSCGIYTLPFTESFSATTLPGCWSQVDHQGNGEIWAFGTITTGVPNPTLTGNYAFVNSDGFGSGNSQNADLVSPTLNLVAYSAVTLQFSNYFKSYAGSSGTLSYSIDNGTTWSQVVSYTTTSATNPAVFNQVIGGVAGQASVKFKWNYTGTYGYYWAIDDISITGTAAATLSVTPANQNVASAAGTTPFSVTTSSAWTATSNAAWCTLTPSGTGNGTLTATYTQNTGITSRVATLTVTVTGAPPVSVTVTQAAASPTLTVTPPNQNVSAPAGNTSFTVASNTSWSAASDAAWCTVTPSGSGNGTITATYTQNILLTARTANISVTATGVTTVLVTVTQSAGSPTLSVTPAIQNVTAPAGNTSFTVTSNSAWTAASDAAWCTITPSGSGNGTITATYTQNIPLTARNANITVTVSGLSPVVVSVAQSAGSPMLTVTPSNQNVSTSAGSANFAVTSNLAWSASSNAAWCTVTPSGTGDGTIVADFSANALVTSRVATITVTAAGAPGVYVTVTQSGTAATLLVSPSSQNVTASAGNAAYTVTSNSAWTVTSNSAWCTVTLSGSGNGSITAAYLQNTSMAARSAYITVTVAGLPSVTVTLLQDGSAATLSVSPATRTVTDVAGSTTFNVTSNTSWTCSSNAIWCQPTAAGSGTGIITASYQQNNTQVIRTAAILVGASGASPVTVQLIQLPSFVSVADQPEDTFKIYPNPTRGLFVISSASLSMLDFQLSILDTEGRTIIRKLCKGLNSYTFDLSQESNGSYFLKIETGGKTHVVKVLVQK